MKQYAVVHFYENGVRVIKYKKNIFSKTQWGIKNEKGEITLFSGEFENVVVLSTKLIARKVKLGKDKFKWELAKYSGQRICQPKYDKCPKWVVRDRLLFAPVNNQIALIDNVGHQLCKPQYTRLAITTSDRTCGVVCEGARDGYWYKINIKGVELEAKYYRRCY